MVKLSGENLSYRFFFNVSALAIFIAFHFFYNFIFIKYSLNFDYFAASKITVASIRWTLRM